MSSFLSHVHQQLYMKMRYQDMLNDELLLLLQKKDPCTQELLEHKLVEGNLENVIDLDRIHDWLHSHIELLEYRTNYLLGQVEEKHLIEDATILMQEIGKECGKGQIFNDLIQVFTFLQQYMLNGMPCDSGITILEKSFELLSFKCLKDVHVQIDNYPLYAKLRYFWIQGVLSTSLMNVTYVDEDTYCLMKQEDATCKI